MFELSRHTTRQVCRMESDTSLGWLMPTGTEVECLGGMTRITGQSLPVLLFGSK